jgi:hypothetical protein
MRDDDYLVEWNAMYSAREWQGHQEQVWAPVDKFFQFPPPSPLLPSRVGWLKFIDAKLDRLTLSCRVTWTCSESVNLCRHQIMILVRTTKMYTTQSGLGPLSEPPHPLMYTGLGPGRCHYREVSLHSSMLPSSSTLMVAGSVSQTQYFAARLHGVTHQKTVIFITLSDLTRCRKLTCTMHIIYNGRTVQSRCVS